MAIKKEVAANLTEDELKVVKECEGRIDDQILTNYIKDHPISVDIPRLGNPTIRVIMHLVKIYTQAGWKAEYKEETLEAHATILLS